MSTTRALVTRLSLAALTASAFVSKALAFGGPLPELPGTPNGLNVRGTIGDLLAFILSFTAIAAVVVIVIAGIRLILSQGDEGAKDTAKKTIFYAIAGLIIILLARVIVGFITNDLPGRLQPY